MQIDVTTQAEEVAYFADLDLQDLAPGSKALYKKSIRYFLQWLDGDSPTAQSGKLFLDHLRQKGRSPNTIHSYYVPIRLFLSYRGQQFKVKLRRPKQLPRYHSTEELLALLHQAEVREDRWRKNGSRDSLIMRLLATTGLRASELVSLRVKDISLSNRFIFIRQGKGHKDRSVPLAAALVPQLAAWIRDQGLKTGDSLFYLKRWQVNNLVTRYARLAGVEHFSPHSFRHYFATSLLEQGTSIKAVQELLGHASISTTAVYLDLLPQHLHGAVDSLPLANINTANN